MENLIFKKGPKSDLDLDPWFTNFFSFGEELYGWLVGQSVLSFLVLQKQSF